MQLIWLVVFVLVIFSVAYLGYSRYLARLVELDGTRQTPAHRHQDGKEYVPARKIVLVGHHFSSIAGGAPIVGPITAALIWGWVPALLWVVIGNPLLGAMHDFIAMVGSLRHDGKSVGSVLGTYLGPRNKNLLLWFAFLAIILVIAVFALVVSIVFDAYPQAATASLIYIGLALLFGIYMYWSKLPFVLGSFVFVAAVFVSVWIGLNYPVALFESENAVANAPNVLTLFNGTPSLPSVINANVTAWIPVVLIYALVASVLPVWLLLQPRDYLSSFLLYTGIGGVLLGIIVGTMLGTASQPLEVGLQAYKGFWGGDTGLPMFPVMFVMIACGAISGFHSLVSSGTTAKQLNRESDARLIGYGGMLGEGLLAVAAIATVGVAMESVGKSGIALALPNFATGGGIILSSFGLPASYGGPFMALVLVSFLLTSTDTAVRLGRYLFEEIVGKPVVTTGWKRAIGNSMATSTVQVVGGYLLIVSGSWATLWALFGSANQLLAALALLAGTVWLANWDSRKELLSTGIPMVLVALMTFCALLFITLYQNLYTQLLNAEWVTEATKTQIASLVVQMGIAAVLTVLAATLFWTGAKNILGVRQRAVRPSPS